MQTSAHDAGESEPSPDDAAPVAPIAPAARIAGLDIVRGIAVLGILIPNIVAFGQPLEAGFSPSLFQSDPGPGAAWLWAAQFVLVDGKMRGLFALLFGAGLALFAERGAGRAGAGMRQVRRLLVLALFGAAHAVLLWGGDILWAYALVGLVVLPFLALPREGLLVLGLVSALAGAAFYAGAEMEISPLANRTPAAEAASALARQAMLDSAQEDAAAQTAIVRAGDYPAYVAFNWDYFAYAPFFEAYYAGFELFPLMLIGAALYRFGLFAGALRRRALGWSLWGAGALGGAGIAAWALAHELDYFATGMAFGAYAPLPVLAMTLGLALLLGPWAAQARGPAARLLAGAGRTAFSNYLGTSALMLAVFHGWGLGLFGALGRAELYGVAVLAWAVMLAWPQWWLARYRHGPLEWLWRCLTYGRRVPLARAA